MSLLELSMLAQILTAIITFIGIVISMWLSIKALKEVQIDRKLRQKPNLGFEIGGHQLSIEFKKAGKTIPSINPLYVEKIFYNIPDDAESIRLKEIEHKSGIKQPLFYGKLINYGLGPALSTKVTWIPQEIWISSEKFVIDHYKLLEPPYQRELNSMPVCPSHILPGKVAELSRIPTFIEKDFEKKITQVKGFFEIEYKDIFGEGQIVKQEFYIFTDYKSEDPYIIVTFSDFIEDEK